MPAARPPFMQTVLDTVVPVTARWLVARMRRMEEMDLSPAARWELLRNTLEQIGREKDRWRASPGKRSTTR